MKKVILSIIIILVIVLLGLGGYLLYTKLNAKNIDVSAINIANSAEVKNMVNESSNKVENIVESQNANKIESQNANKIESKNANKIESQETNATESQESIIRRLFLKELEKDNENCSEKLEDYRIDSIQIYQGKEREDIISTWFEGENANSLEQKVNISSASIFASVNYSVKPKDINNTVWIAGSGSADKEGWLNKGSYVYADKKDGNYEIIDSGTGW